MVDLTGCIAIIITIIVAFTTFALYVNNRVKKVEKLVEPMAPVIKEVDNWLKIRGLNGLFEGEQSKNTHHSLPSEEARRRDQLIQKGKQYGLDQYEAEQLKRLLDEDARSDVASGIISALAFVLIVVAIAALISALTRRT